MLKQLRDFCEKNSLLQRGKTVLVACSGGPDSMAMLDMLLNLKAEMGFSLAVAHFEHGIRGQESLNDAAFVQEYCDRHDVPFYMKSANVPEWSRTHGESLETSARKLRYSFLQETAKIIGGADIATAHHRDDQAETVLMHILRGSGLTGLSGIRPRRGNIIRPVLFLSKEQLMDYCYMNGIEARMDRTNEIADCTRNRIRLNLMPNLASTYNQGITEGLCHLAEIAATDGDYLQQESLKAYEKLVNVRDGILKFQIEEFLKLHTAIQRRIIQKMVSVVSDNKSADNFSFCGISNWGYVHLKLLSDFIENGRTGTRISLPGDIQASMDYGVISIFRKTALALSSVNQENIELQVPGDTFLKNGGGCISAEIYEGELPEKIRSNKSVFQVILDYKKCCGRLQVKYRRDGDRIQLKAGSKKLKDFFIDRKIPREERAKIPLIWDDRGILWVVGVKHTQLGVYDENTELFLVLTFERGV